MKRLNASGFTLIELLVVIAIISILAGILFPVFSQARERARAIACMSNLNQLGKAIVMYSDDNNGRFPIALAENGIGPSWAGFTEGTSDRDVTKGGLYSYVKSAEVFLCPTDPWARTLGLSYEFSGPLSIFPMGQVDAPSDTVMLVDANDAAANGARSQNGRFEVASTVADAFVIPPALGLAENTPTDGLNMVHNHRANACYVDGHVGSVKEGALTARSFRAYATAGL